MSFGTRPHLFLAFVVALILFRQIAASFEVFHFQPYIALFFGLTALRSLRWVLIPTVAYVASTIIAVGSVQPWMLSILFAFALIVLWAKCFSKRSSIPALLGGSLGGAGIFYFVTNSLSWLTDGQYAKTFGGFTQALWTGIPSYPPTWTFFRNDALATVLFMAILVVLDRMPLEKRAESAAPARA